MKTIEINIVGESYESRSKPLSAQKTLNLYPEVNPDTRALHCRPGAKLFSSGEGINRGIAEWLGHIYAVNGTKLVKVSQTGERTEVGAVPGGGRCMFAGDGNYLYFVTGGKSYRTDGTILELNSDPDLTNALSIAFIKGFFVYNDSDYWAVSFPGDGSNVSSLDKGQAEAVNDDLVRQYVFKQSIYMFGSKSAETWYLNGGTEPPISSVEGGLVHKGLAGTHAVTHTENALYFLGHDKTVYRMQGYGAAEQISKVAINNAIENYKNVSDCFAWSMKLQGQDFVVFTFPSEGATWVYSEPFNEWHELSTGNGRYLANDYVYAFGKHLISDYRNGNLYELDLDTFTDGGEMIVRERVLPTMTGAPLGAPGQRIVCSRFELILERGQGLATGQGSNPVVMISVSEDGGKTYDKEQFVNPGSMGAYQQKVEWLGFAVGYELAFKIRVTDPINLSITRAAADIDLAGY